MPRATGFKAATAAVLAGVGFTGAIFVCVTLHEYGHALMARRFGIRTKDLIAKLATAGLSAQIQDTMRRDFPIADLADSLESVFSRLHESETRTVPVVRNGQLLGLLTLDNLREYLLIQGAIKPRGNRARVKQILIGEGSFPV